MNPKISKLEMNQIKNDINVRNAKNYNHAITNSRWFAGSLIASAAFSCG
jgi:hypothetical protein